VEPYTLLDEESPNFFKFFASGRVNVKYCMTSLEMQRRQDLVMSYIYGLIWAQKDRISFDIPFHIEGQAPPLCFAIMKKKLESEALEGYKDLKILTKKFKVDGVSEKFTVLSDHVEMIAWLFDKNMKDFLSKFEKHVEMIHVSDRQTFFKT
jgi:Protein of unknown function (DUF1682)